MPPSVLANDDDVRHLVPGLALPNVTLPSTLGGMVTLSAMSGATVVYFYPWTGRAGFADPPGWDDIPGAHGSTPETEGFRDHYPAFQDMGVAVFGISTQGSEHQRELTGRLNIPFAMLSDESFLLQKALKLPTFETGGVAYLKRLTLIVLGGSIEHVFYPVHTPPAHARDVLDWLTSAGAPGAA